jgi:hypothetical protein
MPQKNLSRNAALLLSLGAVASHAATWHVSPSGSDSKDGRTAATAYASPAKGIAAAKAGDTVLLAGGTYAVGARIVISASGTASQPIHLLAEDPYAKRAVLDFTTQGVGNSNQGIQLSGNYWHIKGLDIENAGDNGMLVDGGSYDTIEWCSFHENSDAGMQLRHGASHDYVLNCDSYWNYDAGTQGGNADGFSPKLDVGDSVVFVGCRSWGNSDDGWDGYLKTAGTSYPDNVTTVIENCWAFDNGYWHGDPTSPKNNSEMNGNGFKMGGSPDKDQRHPHVLKRCLSFGNKSKQFDQNNNPGSMTLLNCSAYGSGLNFAVTMALAAGSSLTVENCLSIGGGSVKLLSGDLEKTNSWSSGFSASASDVQSIDTTGVRAPRKADGSLPDIAFMHLKAGSKLVDAGTKIDGIAYNGTAPDLGAFETASGAVGIAAAPSSGSSLQIRADGSGSLRIVTTAQVADLKASIRDLSGRALRSAEFGPRMAGSQAEMSLSELRPGLYLVRVSSSAGAFQDAKLLIR